jgi:hypothetical protein
MISTKWWIKKKLSSEFRTAFEVFERNQGNWLPCLVSACLVTWLDMTQKYKNLFDWLVGVRSPQRRGKFLAKSVSCKLLCSGALEPRARLPPFPQTVRWQHVAFFTRTTLQTSCIIHMNWNWELFSSNWVQIWIWNSSQKRYQGLHLCKN